MKDICAVFFPAFIHETANRAAGGIIDTGYATGSNGDKGLICCLYRRRSHKKDESE